MFLAEAEPVKTQVVAVILRPRKQMKKLNSKKSTKVAKKAQEAKQMFLCMNVKFEGNESVIKIGETRNVRLKFVDEDNFLATEKKTVVPVNKGTHRLVLARTVHGTLSADEFGFHIGFYIRHDEVKKNEALAEMLEAEAEEMGDRIVEMEAICC